MKKIIFLLISFLIGLSLFVWVIKTVGWPEIKKAFLVFTAWQGIVIFGLSLLAVLIAALRWREILNGIGIKISFKKLWKIYSAAYSLRYLAPAFLFSAEIFQTHTLKEMNSVPWQKGLASAIIDRILDLTAGLFVIFFGLSFFLYKIGLPPLKLGLGIAGFLLILVFLLTFFYFKSFKRESMAKAIGRIFNHHLDSQPLETEKEIFNFFKVNRISIWKSFSLSFLKTAILYLRAWLLILFLGKNIGPLPVFSILGFSLLIGMIPIPADIGSHEAIQVFAFNALGVGAGLGPAYAMTIRGAEIIVCLFGAVFLCRLAVDIIKNKLLNKAEKTAEKFWTEKKNF